MHAGRWTVLFLREQLREGHVPGVPAGGLRFAVQRRAPGHHVVLLRGHREKRRLRYESLPRARTTYVVPKALWVAFADVSFGLVQKVPLKAKRSLQIVVFVSLFSCFRLDSGNDRNCRSTKRQQNCPAHPPTQTHAPTHTRVHPSHKAHILHTHARMFLCPHPQQRQTNTVSFLWHTHTHTYTHTHTHTHTQPRRKHQPECSFPFPPGNHQRTRLVPAGPDPTTVTRTRLA